MPWCGDQFEYTHGYIRLILETFFERQEEARRAGSDPFRNSSMPYYDILCALNDVSLTKKQWEAFSLRLCGFSYREIAQILGCFPNAIYERIGWAEKKILEYLASSNCTETPPTGVSK